MLDGFLNALHYRRPLAGGFNLAVSWWEMNEDAHSIYAVK